MQASVLWLNWQLSVMRCSSFTSHDLCKEETPVFLNICANDVGFKTCNKLVSHCAMIMTSSLLSMDTCLSSLDQGKNKATYLVVVLYLIPFEVIPNNI